SRHEQANQRVERQPDESPEESTQPTDDTEEMSEQPVQDQPAAEAGYRSGESSKQSAAEGDGRGSQAKNGTQSTSQGGQVQAEGAQKNQTLVRETASPEQASGAAAKAQQQTMQQLPGKPELAEQAQQNQQAGKQAGNPAASSAVNQNTQAVEAAKDQAQHPQQSQASARSAQGGERAASSPRAGEDRSSGSQLKQAASPQVGQPSSGAGAQAQGQEQDQADPRHQQGQPGSTLQSQAASAVGSAKPETQVLENPSPAEASTRPAHLEQGQQQQKEEVGKSGPLGPNAQQVQPSPDQQTTGPTHVDSTMHKAPLIEHDGRIIAESGAIAQHLLESFDAAHRLHPAPGDAARPVFLEWMHAAEGAVFLPFLMNTYLEATGLTDSLLAQYMGAERAKALGAIEAHLAANPYVAGAAFTAADIMMGFQLESADRRGAIDKDSPVKAWLERTQQREAWHAMRRITTSD
ncbi:MAG: glutathione S-transferase C-terminal domain-containing protein, partial [Oceanicaulis sp.]